MLFSRLFAKRVPLTHGFGSISGNWASWEEDVGHDFGGLASCGVSCRAEVGEVGWWDARLASTTAQVTRHYPTVSQPPDKIVEGVSGWHILELLRTRRFGEARSVRHYLR
jgi:hypothetical protein